MLMVHLLAGASAMFSFAATPAAQHLCAAQAVVVPVSLPPVPNELISPEGHLPEAGTKSRDPAVLLPECKEAPRQKRRKRKSDYPMA